MSTFVEAYREIVRTRGGDAAIESLDGTLSHAAVWARAGELALKLRAMGVGRDVVVALSMTRSDALVIGMIAVWRAGAAWVVVEPSSPEVRRRRLVEIAGARVEIALGEVRRIEAVAEGDRAQARERDRDRASRDGDRDRVRDSASCEGDRDRASRDHDGGGELALDGSALAYVAFTSGSSGDPKGVRVEHRGLVPMLRAQIEAFGIDGTTRALWVLSPSFDASVSDVGTVLLAGGTLLIDGPELLGDRERLLETIARREVTSIDLPPSVLVRLDIARLPPSLRTIVIGGEVADVRAVRRAAARVRVVNVYGPTEATVCTSLERCDVTWRGGTLGTPLPHVRYRLEGDELWIGGDCLARDYAGDPTRTAERFVWRDGERWYRTGDRVRREGDTWIFEGRLDRQVKLAGKRAEPAEVEHALRGLGVEAAVIPRERGGRTVLVAFATDGIANGSVLDMDTILCHPRHPLAEPLRTLIPAWLIPSAWVVLPSLPRTAHGKIDLAALGRMPLRQPPTSWPDDPTERRLAELFATVLGLDAVDAEGDFFSLGGDSLALLTLLARAEAAGVPLSASQVLASPRVRDLARLRERERDPEVRSTLELARFVSSRVVDARRLARLGPRDTLVLTGATGFLGVRLHRALLLRGHRVVAIVRAPSNDAARRRVEGGALAGDVALPRLGLDAGTYEGLAARTVGVVHLAARVSLAASYEVLAPANVDGTANALELATAAGVPFVHASTLSVFVASDRTSTTFFEHDDASSPCRIAGGYAQSKWVAEQLVRRAEVPTTIVRYGLLTPDRERFASPEGDWLVRFVRELAAREELPGDLLEGELSFDATPVDHAVVATLRLVELGARGTFHVAGARAVNVARLIDAMCAEGVRLARPPSSDAVTTRTEARVAPMQISFAEDATCVLGAARAHAPDRFARHRGLDLFAATGVRFDDTRARSEGIVAPEVDDAYLRGCVRAMLRS